MTIVGCIYLRRWNEYWYCHDKGRQDYVTAHRELSSMGDGKKALLLSAFSASYWSYWMEKYPYIPTVFDTVSMFSHLVEA